MRADEAPDGRRARRMTHRGITHALGLLLLTSCQSPKVVELRVLTASLHRDADFWQDRFAVLADAIVRLRPDVVCAQELQLDADQPTVLTGLVRARDPALDYHFDAERRTGDYAVTGEGLAIFSPHTLATRFVRDLGEGRLALFDRLRVSADLTIDIYDTELDLLATDAVRARELGSVITFMGESARGFPTILAGNLNATPDSPALAPAISANLLDTWAQATGSPDGGATAPIQLAVTPVPQHPTDRLDYVFLAPPKESQTIRVASSTVTLARPNIHGLYASDHLGVMTTIEIDLNTL